MTSEGTVPAAATTQRKPRSLADLVDEQVKGGLIDPKEASRPVDWKDRSRGPPGEGARDRGNASTQGGGGRWGGNRSGGEATEGDSSLNWQQRELLGQGSSNSRGGHQSGGGGSRNRGGGGANNGGNTFASFGFGDRRGGSQQQQGGGRGGGNGPNTNNRNAPPPKNPNTDLPEWATGLDTNSGGAAGEADSALNWQQKSLMNRDESNPFNRLVRGEDEYFRE